MPEDVNSPERWRADLKRAGWKEIRLSVFQAPDGALFRGPYGAWCQLQGWKPEPCESCGRTAAVRFRPEAAADLCNDCYQELCRER
jgi:hypothetical protein